MFPDSQSNQQSNRKPILDPQTAALQAHSKAVADSTYDQTRAGLSQGVSQQDLTQSLIKALGIDQTNSLINTVAAQRMPSSTSSKGIIWGLLDLARGKGFDPNAAWNQVPIGTDEAQKRISMAIGLNKLPYEMSNLQAQNEKNPYELKKIQQETNPEFQLGMEQAKQGITSGSQELLENRKQLDQFIPAATKGMSSIDKIEQAAIQLGDFKQGFFNQMASSGKSALEQFKKTPQYVRFNSIVSQELSNISRNLAGEKGTLTDQDVNRVKEGIGNITLPLDQKLELLDSLRLPIGDELQARLSLAERPMESIGQRFPRLSEGIQKSTKRQEERQVSRILNPMQAKNLGAIEFDDKTGEYFDSKGKVVGRSR